MNFNRAIILGNLTRDPEMKTLPSGQSVTNFSIATNRIYNDKTGAKQQTTEFHNVVAFGKLADIAGRYLSRGKMVLVEGRLQTRSWQAQDGSKRYRTEIVAENMQLGPKGGGSNDSFGGGAPQSGQQNTPEIEEIPVIEAEPDFGQESAQGTEGGVNVKDIPF
ncbi:MAG: Single-stranded DNA-binding protein [Parcubacteria group bacterium GW2011_GWA1_42_7]|nr:MAG: Single-stranded DNA-binding protein [Parcubacteria group bacterium GW2011_GWA1_42_7]